MTIHYSHKSDMHPLRLEINKVCLADEAEIVRQLVQQVKIPEAVVVEIVSYAGTLIERIRSHVHERGAIDSLLHEYDLSTQEGITLMCLAEAMLRIPDAETADHLIKDKLGPAEWDKHMGHSHSFFVNASTWGLMLTGKLMRYEQETMDSVLIRLLARSSDPLIRTATRQAMNIIGHQFVLGETIEHAMQRIVKKGPENTLYSFDMLGEAALSKADAQRYRERYLYAVGILGHRQQDVKYPAEALEISLKLSALHPRFEYAQRKRVLDELVPDVLLIAQQAREAGVNVIIDAEEAARLEITLDVFEAVYTDQSMAGWEGLGIAVQTYQKRAPAVIKWLAAIAREGHRRIIIRLVKGAYWDSEIKQAQEQGLDGYPVFTRKPYTDLSYLACVQQVFELGEYLYPQFASHNAYTIAMIKKLAAPQQEYEFQRLHGMGEDVYDELLRDDSSVRCRVYAPVGSYNELLPYLVRRLLENGANNSFVNRIENERVAVDELTQDPVAAAVATDFNPHPRIPLPCRLFGQTRLNSSGINFYDTQTLLELERAFAGFQERDWHAASLIREPLSSDHVTAINNPANISETIGHVAESTIDHVCRALAVTYDYHPQWSRLSVEQRAQIAERAGKLLEAHRDELMYLCIREGGRCIRDSLSDLREAVDACHYYAMQARTSLSEQTLSGPVGESNTLSTHGRGVIICISPWNFPLAIFTGQIIAALLAGNTVIAKPAHQTPLTAMRIVELLHEAGIPLDALCLLPGQSNVIGPALLSDERIAGVIFTGSTAVARHINRTLTQHDGPIVPLIAETGGQNAMIVDSSALPEQVVHDVMASAFNSAGQRCSALRVLFLQDDIAERVIDLLKGAMDELSVGDPLSLATDVGPLIDAQSKKKIMSHIEWLQGSANYICKANVDADLLDGNFIAPVVYEIASLSMLKEEIFGPVLHVVRYAAAELDNVINAINNTGYGLTLGIHSRIEEKAQYIAQRVRAGNIYVNRNIIGAVVGVQPFGGEGLSGTGPKAGGPNYLQRLVNERIVTINTAAIGGNASLLNL